MIKRQDHTKPKKLKKKKLNWNKKVMDRSSNSAALDRVAIWPQSLLRRQFKTIKIIDRSKYSCGPWLKQKFLDYTLNLEF